MLIRPYFGCKYWSISVVNNDLYWLQILVFISCKYRSISTEKNLPILAVNIGLYMLLKPLLLVSTVTIALNPL